MRKIFASFICFLICGCADEAKHRKTIVLVNLADAPAIPEERKEISIIVPSSILQKNAAQIETPKKKLDYDKKNAESLDDYCYEEDPPTSDDYALSAYDVIARKLAGLGSDVDAEYAKFVRTKWKKLNENSLGLIRSWSRKHIVPLLNDCQTVFYPLGGPDMSCPFKFFPDAQTYILVGLEPIGNFQDISTNIQNPAIFKAMKEAFSWFLQNGFFLTSEMSKTLSSKSLNGTLYLILPQLTRLGFYVSNIEDLSITANGQEISRSKGSVDCVKITCRKDSDEAPRFIYYVRANLAEENPKLNNLLNFMKNRSFVTFLKSASYVFYCRTFTKFKTFLLANSEAILQDDTGIPFDSFGLKWQKYPFGIYTGPLIKVFKNYKQPAMANFYKSSDTVKIPFKIGYGFLLAKPSLLLAVQNKAIQSNKAESNKIMSEESTARKETQNNIVAAESEINNIVETTVENQENPKDALPAVSSPSIMDFLDHSSSNGNLLQQQVSTSADARVAAVPVDEEALRQYMAKMLTITEIDY